MQLAGIHVVHDAKFGYCTFKQKSTYMCIFYIVDVCI